MYHGRVKHSTPDQVASAVLEILPPAMRAIRMQMRSGRAPGLSVAQFRLLLFVRRHPGCDLSATAEHLDTSLPAASQLVDRLVRAGLLDRTVRPEERRHVDLRVTEAGAETLSRCDAATRAWLCQRLEVLTESQLDALAEALGDLRSVIAGDGQPPDRGST
jgi:DNA-binding MarR family transcriptional regulator